LRAVSGAIVRAISIEIVRNDERIFIGLGANLGDARGAVRQALTALEALPRSSVHARSSLYRSAPVNASGPDYVNAVAEMRSALDPAELLTALQAIEARHGRERPFPNAPRTLDLDLLLFGDRLVTTPTLVLPHPRLHRRAFVLRPLAELDPGLVLPGLGPIGPWLLTLDGQFVERL
jgi:2-amino-4-hydroxy-6-hydroxymethyldihydropteridine diphosphokinase